MTTSAAPAAEPSIEPRAAAPARSGPWTRELLAFAELFAIAGLAFAQPAFDLLSKNVSILVVRDIAPWQVVALTLLFLFAPVVPAYLIEVVVGAIAPSARRWVHALFVGCFAAVLVEEAVKHGSSLSPTALIIVGLIGGLVAAAFVLFVDAARTFLRFLAIAPLLFALLFVGFSPASKTVFKTDPPSASGAAIGNPKRVVMIVMDELPLGTLLDGSGRIDATLYPNFAALAGTSSWYRNTTTVSPYTDWAVPALTTGQDPKSASQLPTAGDHPDSIFRLLGGAYQMNVHEAVTHLCPDSICPATKGTTSSLRNLVGTAKDSFDLWKEFAKPEPTKHASFVPPPSTPSGSLGARGFIASLQPGTDRRFDFLHVMLPHQPWHLLPTTQDAGYLDDGVFGKANLLKWIDDGSAQVGQERHILQTQAADNFLGQIVSKLKRLGAWDDSVVVLTADHGLSFTTGEPLRSATDKNIDQILWVPTFIKAPNQSVGKVDDRPMETIDIVPTVADLLQIKIPWKVDGASAQGKPRAEFDRRLFEFKLAHFQPPGSLISKDGESLKFDPGPLWPKVMARQAAAPVGDPALRPYRIGDYGGLIGTPVPGVAEVRANTDSRRLFLLDPHIFDAVDPSAPVVPWTSIEGGINGLDRWQQPIIFAVNGVFAGIGDARTYANVTNGYYFASLAPQFFRPGQNDVTAYLVSGPADHPVLDPVTIDRAGASGTP